MLHKVTKVITRNLNKIIDVNYYPVPEAEDYQKNTDQLELVCKG